MSHPVQESDGAIKTALLTYLRSGRQNILIHTDFVARIGPIRT